MKKTQFTINNEYWTGNFDFNSILDRTSSKKNKVRRRRDKCHCGSGRKYKKCCYQIDRMKEIHNK